MAAKDPSAALDKLMASMVKPKVKPEVLLAELDELLRNRPTHLDISDQSDDTVAWIGRAAAVIAHWDSPRGNVLLITVQQDLHSGAARRIEQGYTKLIELLNEARHSIRLISGATLNVAVEPGMVFDYFDGIERAAADLFFIDPYLDADFVSRYLGFVRPDITVRLLAGQTSSQPCCQR